MSSPDEIKRVSVTAAGPPEDAALTNLSEFWHYDFSEILGADVGEDGRFGSRGFDRPLAETERFLIRVDGHLAGFACLQRHEGAYRLDRFFVMRKYRRRGIGELALRQLLGVRPGLWTLTVRPQNVAALGFWRRTLPRLWEDVVEDDEREFEDGVRRIRFRFRVASSPREGHASNAPTTS